MSSKNNRFAAIDLGSNTIRLLVAEPGPAGFVPIHADQVITRLGERMHETGSLGRTAMRRSLDGIARLISGASHLKPFTIAATATHAVRSASNRNEFEELFEKELGFPLCVIDWKMEAALSLKGVDLVIGDHVPILLFDIGGGSTEFIYRDAGGNISSAGTELGVVRLTETFLTGAPLKTSEYESLESYLAEEVSRVKKRLAPEGGFTIVGTAGTITSLAAIRYDIFPYDASRINNLLLTREDVAGLLKTLGSMTLEERGKLPPLENGREDLIIPGIGIVLAVMDVFGKDSLRVSDSGLREGIMFSIMDGTIPGSGR